MFHVNFLNNGVSYTSGYGWHLLYCSNKQMTQMPKYGKDTQSTVLQLRQRRNGMAQPNYRTEIVRCVVTLLLYVVQSTTGYVLV